MLNGLIAKEKRSDVGVIVGRFQTSDLHEIHKKLIEEVRSRHERVLVFLGVSPVLGSRRNPLDFESRKRMIQTEFPALTILPIKDMKSDDRWSDELDARIKEIYPTEKVVLYGGRDSFIGNYTGKFEICEFEQIGLLSATKLRERVAKEVRASSDWRAGVIYGVFNQYKKTVMCVDIALLREERKKVVLGKRMSEDKHRFFGGHVDPKDENLEHCAKRELLEEAGKNLEVSCLTYAGSFPIDDWRYRNNRDKIMTALFVGEYLFGNLEAGDDIDELKEFNVEDFLDQDFLEKNLAEEHFPLMKNLINFLRKETHPCKDMKK